MFQTSANLKDHHTSILEMFHLEHVDQFEMDLRGQINAFHMNSDRKISVNWNAEQMDVWLNPNNPEWDMWTTKPDVHIPRVEAEYDDKNGNKIFWSQLGSVQINDYVGK